MKVIFIVVSGMLACYLCHFFRHPAQKMYRIKKYTEKKALSELTGMILKNVSKIIYEIMKNLFK